MLAKLLCRPTVFWPNVSWTIDNWSTVDWSTVSKWTRWLKTELICLCWPTVFWPFISWPKDSCRHSNFVKCWLVDIKCVNQMSFGEKVFDQKMEPNFMYWLTDIWPKDSCRHSNFVKCWLVDFKCVNQMSFGEKFFNQKTRNASKSPRLHFIETHSNMFLWQRKKIFPSQLSPKISFHSSIS